MLGRLIGLVFAIGFVWLWVRKHLSRPLVPHLIAMFVLGGLQGLLGWYMVKSGLVDRPSVSQYRLTAHLGVAVAIYALMMWLVLRVSSGLSPALQQISGWGWVLVLSLIHI